MTKTAHLELVTPRSPPGGYFLRDKIMAVNIATPTELFHRFHTCEMHVKQGQIATCLLAFRQIIDGMNVIPLTEKEKKEFGEAVEVFLKHLCTHKKFKEIFGDLSFGDTDLKTNLEFMKSMIVAQEQFIIQRVEEDEAAAEAQRLDMEKTKQKKKDDMQQKIKEAIRLIDEDNLPQALEIIGTNDQIRDEIVRHFNENGIELRKGEKPEEAAKCFSKALAITPGDEHLHYNIGRTYYESHQLDKAESYLDRALKINPNFAEGKILHEYLLKLKQARTDSSGDGGGNMLGGLFRKLSSFKKYLPTRQGT
jgi:tetratricopeptide (TPR) repeat protein